VLTALQDTLGSDVALTDAGIQQQQQRMMNSFMSRGSVQDPAARVLCLQQLTQLTSFKVEPYYFPRGAEAPFSALQQLQHLKLTSSLQDSQTGVLAKLPVSLTHLELCWGGKRDLDMPSAPAIATLTALQTFKVPYNDSSRAPAAGGGVNPQLLAHMQQLRVLDLDQLSSNALPALLQVMPRLSNLQQLELNCAAVEPLPVSEAAR
jgi:hypothetical protein